MRILRAGTAGIFSIACASTLSAQSIVSVGVLDGRTRSEAVAVSGDGSIVLVRTYNGTFQDSLPARWSVQSGLAALPPLAGQTGATARDISADGNTIVGTASFGTSGVVVRWVGANPPENLSLPMGALSVSADGVNADGSVIVGSYRDISGSNAFRWTLGTYHEVPGVEGYSNAAASRSSADGGFIFGGSWETGPTNAAFVWSAAAGTLPLFPFPLGSTSFATDATADGAVVFGYVQPAHAFESRAVRWPTRSTVEELDRPFGYDLSQIQCTNADGSIAGGWIDKTTPNFPQQAALWTLETGMIDLHAHLTSLGVDLTGWTLSVVTDLSADGRTMVGNGTLNGELRGWVVTLPDACTADFNDSGTVDATDIFVYLDAWFTQNGQSGPNLSADFDGSGTVDATDIFVFLDAWFEQNGTCV